MSAEANQNASYGGLVKIFGQVIEAALGDPNASFKDLAEAAGLDPATDFVGASLVDVDLRDEDLRGFNFAKADLTGADFRRANVEDVSFNGAILTRAIGLPVHLTVEALAAEPRVLDVTDVLVEMSHLLRRVVGENIELRIVHARNLGLAELDRNQLEQVIINLAVNARDAMAGGGTLLIRTGNITQTSALRRGHEVMPAGNYVVIEVSDTGVGISRENLAHIFQPGFSTKELGTGMGLPIVYGMVKQTGGFVLVDSTPGEGATFQIYLPRHQTDDVAFAGARRGSPEHADNAEPPAARDLTAARTVMLVEDEDRARIFGARVLRDKGYNVLEAKSGEAALEMIQNTEKIDVMITNLVMPKMDGPGLVRQVRQIIPDIKVIFTSGYTVDDFGQRLDGDIYFLPKPFSPRQLTGKIKEVIRGEAG